MRIVIFCKEYLLTKKNPANILLTIIEKIKRERMDGLNLKKFFNILNRSYVGQVINDITLSSTHLYLRIYNQKLYCLEYQFAITQSGNVGLQFTESTVEVSNAISDAVKTHPQPEILKLLKSTKIIECWAVGYDRIAFIKLAKQKVSSKIQYYTLVFEPVGSMANFFILGDDNKILFNINANNIDPNRQIEVGRKYFTFKANKTLTLENYINSTQQVTNFDQLQGFYPPTAIAANSIAEKLGGGKLGFDETALIIRNAIEAQTEQNFYQLNNVIYPFNIEGATQFDFLHTPFLSQKKQSKSANAQQENIKQLNKLISNQKKKYTNILKKLDIDLAKASKFDELRKEADLIKLNLHNIQGIGNYQLTFWNEDGIEETVNYEMLSQNPRELMTKLYAKASRYEQSINIINDRIAKITNTINYINEIEFLATNDNQPIAISDIEELLNTEFKTNKSKQQTKKSQQKLADNKRGYYETILPSGTILFAGKNAAGNYNLVFRIANNDDLWLHTAKGVPSSHVILRPVSYNVPISDEELTLGGQVVARLSKLKSERYVEVDYTKRKHVKKPKDSPEGLVIYDRFETIRVTPLSDDDFNLLFPLK